MCYVDVCMVRMRTTVYYDLLCMGRPTWVPLMCVVHVRDPRPKEEPEAVEGKESAAQHGD